jgi:hypothetical protein
MSKGKMVFVFDLDKTIGYFTQVAIFIEGVEDYIGRKLKKQEMYKIFDLYPEIFRPDTMSIFNYLKKIKQKTKTTKVIIFTNNCGPKSWVYDIKKYIEKKIKYKLFDRTIAAWKVNGKVYEKCRTSHEKKYSDLLKCGNLKKSDKIIFLDDMVHDYMINKNVVILHLKAYKHDILFTKMCKIFLKSNIGKIVKKKDHKLFTSNLIKFSREDPLGFSYIESKISSRDGYKKEILSKLKYFVKENKHNISKKKYKKRKRKRNKTLKSGGFW